MRQAKIFIVVTPALFVLRLSGFGAGSSPLVSVSTHPATPAHALNWAASNFGGKEAFGKQKQNTSFFNKPS